MTDPLDKLADDPQRLAATERLRRITGELLVGQVWVVLERPGWLDHEDPAATLTAGELGSPDGRVERCGEVDVVHDSAGLEVRFAPRNEQIADGEVCLRAVQIHARRVHLERHRLMQR